MNTPPPAVHEDLKSPGTARRYGAWALIAAAYAIAYFQRVSPQTMMDVLQRDLQTDVRGAAILASGYFCGYMAMQIPAGVLVDTFGVRGVIIASLAVSSLGSALFSFSGDLSTAFAARLFIAVGDALVFTALIKLVAEQFADSRFGLFSGISQVSGYIGGMIATTPLALAVSTIGWRQAFLGVAALTLLNLVALSFILPAAAKRIDRHRIGKLVDAVLQTLKRLWFAMRSAESWGCAITFCSHFVVAASLSGVWGIPMLMDAYGFDRTEASKPMLLFMMGTIIGSVGLSIISDRTRSLLRWLIIACLARIALLVLIAPSVGNALGPGSVFISFLVLGLIGGGSMPLMLKTTKRVYSTEFIGVGSSFNTTVAVIMTAVMQPVIGSLLDASGQVGRQASLLQWSPYDTVMVLFLATSLLGIVGPFMMRRAIAP
jgi:MFS family permease